MPSNTHTAAWCMDHPMQKPYSFTTLNNCWLKAFIWLRKSVLQSKSAMTGVIWVHLAEDMRAPAPSHGRTMQRVARNEWKKKRQKASWAVEMVWGGSRRHLFLGQAGQRAAASACADTAVTQKGHFCRGCGWIQDSQHWVCRRTPSVASPAMSRLAKSLVRGPWPGFGLGLWTWLIGFSFLAVHICNALSLHQLCCAYPVLLVTSFKIVIAKHVTVMCDQLPNKVLALLIFWQSIYFSVNIRLIKMFSTTTWLQYESILFYSWRSVLPLPWGEGEGRLLQHFLSVLL